MFIYKSSQLSFTQQEMQRPKRRGAQISSVLAAAQMLWEEGEAKHRAHRARFPSPFHTPRTCSVQGQIRPVSRIQSWFAGKNPAAASQESSWAPTSAPGPALPLCPSGSGCPVGSTWDISIPSCRPYPGSNLCIPSSAECSGCC